MAGIIISDASPLIGLSIVDGLSWLPQLFDEVWIPREVQQEVLPGCNAQGEAEILKAIEEKHIQVWQQPIERLQGIDLDEGESACISLALSFSEPMLLLMDEKAGRAVAKEKGLVVTGTAAVIAEAHKRGLIGSAREVFEVLHQSDFRISPKVIKAVLARTETSSNSPE